VPGQTLTPDTLVLSGTLDAKNAKQLLKKTKDYFKGNQLNIDFAKVEYADSVALALILHWLRKARKHNIRLKLLNLPKGLIRIAKLSELDNIILNENGS